MMETRCNVNGFRVWPLPVTDIATCCWFSDILYIQDGTLKQSSRDYRYNIERPLQGRPNFFSILFFCRGEYSPIWKNIGLTVCSVVVEPSNGIFPWRDEGGPSPRRVERRNLKRSRGEIEKSVCVCNILLTGGERSWALIQGWRSKRNTIYQI